MKALTLLRQLEDICAIMPQAHVVIKLSDNSPPCCTLAIRGVIDSPEPVVEITAGRRVQDRTTNENKTAS